MLGLADRGRIRRLLAAGACRRCGGGAGRARRGARARHRPDPAAARADGKPPFGDPRQGRRERRCAAIAPRSAKRAERWRSSFAGARIHRLWQMLLKGLQDVDDRARPARGGGNGAAAADPCRRLARPGLADRQARAARAAPRRRRRRPRAAATAVSAGGPAARRFRRSGQGGRAERQASARPAASRPGRRWSAMRRPSWC